ncbi:D-alanyl-lipoteichoic acid biosynthesis protein DltD [Lactococcus fujiensis]|uniref:Protein DltD n=1 Tax=Lactococcus fujiensis JCM 16395 TaxID=1291764 RepID=A0A2A5RP73_9LACT|nr:D-alanyl-lipoteichoic acid biosynthesis protein DltD [Lactococcus fujiensis]PCS01237.1 cytochrome C551 [Lactococcus fujiensis JCM 16395]
MLIFLPFKTGKIYTKEELLNYANSPKNISSFTGYSVKSEAFSDPEFLPFFGSSEMEHVDSFHPGAYFRKYHAGFTPYFVGQPGTTSLTHYFYLNSVSNELKNRKIVFIISPQWFIRSGISDGRFQTFVSKGEIYRWMLQANPNDITTVQLAEHIQEFKSMDSEKVILSGLKDLSEKKSIGSWKRFLMTMSLNLWNNEDILFSKISQITESGTNLTNSFNNFSKMLPKKAVQSQLDELANQQGKKSSSNNPFQINNNVWNSKLKHKYKSYKNSERKVSYINSPEYADFQQVLNLFAKNKNDVLFIIQPVNGAWSNYVGISEKTMQDFSNKIQYQLSSQGFNNIEDLTSMYKTRYASGDTIHFGTRGWLEADQAIEKFVKQTNALDYKINNHKFLSQKWNMSN